MNDTLVQVSRLVVRYGARTAVRGIEIELRRGEVVGLIGPDGAGKTSALRVIAGLQRATAGAVTVLGQDAWAKRRALHHQLGYLAQRFALYGDLTVGENLQFFALLLGVDNWRARRDELLARVGLAEFRQRQADHLSGGMKQKLALACSLMHEPTILILDEPTTGVDPVTRREFWKLLGELVAEGLTLLVATPYLDEAERCSRVVLMHHGRVLADAAPGTIRSLLPGHIVELAAEPRNLAMIALRQTRGILDVQPFAALLHVHVEPGLPAEHVIRTSLAAAGVDIQRLRTVPATLEDTFLHLTRSASTEEAA